jgi:hypothetical protein
MEFRAEAVNSLAIKGILEVGEWLGDSDHALSAIASLFP